MPETVSFDHYEVLTRNDGSLYELGRGAMGVTYKAFDTSLRVPVALKVINPACLHSELARQRFVREARSAAKLRHRNVATVYHLGTTAETWFYAMEFIDGETVEALVKRHGPLEPALALQIAAQVARALNAAMPHGLVHRDIKPANLMLVREDDELLVKVIDFGLAMSSLPGEAAEEAGGFVGTPHFASPEQLRDDHIDTRSDLYSLGGTLWFMLTGHPPFAGGLEQVKRQHLQAVPPFASLGPIGDAATAILRKALEKDPARRHQTPQEFRRAAEEALAQLAEAAPSAAAAGEARAALLDGGGTPAGETQFEPHAVVAERYRIVERLGETNAGRLFRCFDRQEQREVRLLALQPELLANREAYTQLEHEVEKLSKVHCPNLLEIYDFAALDGASFLVFEWTGGFSVLELLRVRRELSAAETLPLLKQAAAGADHALAQGLGRVDFALHQILLHFPQSIDAEKLLRVPLGAWPAFTLKLNPLGITRELSASETWAGGQTMVQEAAPAATGADTRALYVQALGAFAYELLGGALSPLHLAGATSAPGASHYTPLSTLSEEGNEVLKRALDPAASFATAGEFYDALKRIEVLEIRRPDSPRPLTADSPAASDSGATHRSHAARTSQTAARNKFPVKFLGGLGAAALIAASLYLLKPHPARDPAHEASAEHSASTSGFTDDPPAAPPTDHAAPRLAEAPPTANPEPAGLSAPTAEEAAKAARAEQLRAALAAADATERQGAPAEALAAWLRVAREFPEADAPRKRLDFVIDPMRKQPEFKQPEAFDAIKPLLVEAAQLDALSAVLFLAEGERARDRRAAFAWYSAAAAKGRWEADLPLGLLLSNGVEGAPEFEKAFYYFTQAAEHHDVDAETALAECYLLGKGVGQDFAQGLKWLQEAADQGNLRAMNRLADGFANGRYGLPVKPEEAFRLWSKVSDSKDAAEQQRRPIGEAKGNLGVLYLNGQGVPANEAHGAALLEAGMKLGDSNAAFILGLCQLEGHGVPRNTAQAQSLIKKAAVLGHKGAQAWCRAHGLATPAPTPVVAPL